MMKKLLMLLLTGCLLITAAACGSTGSGEGSVSVRQTESNNTSGTTAPSQPDESKKPSSAGTTEPVTEPSTEPSTTEPETPDVKKTNILVVYFSATNTTKPLAEYVADGLGADLYEIVPAQPYTSADLNYNDDNSRSTKEMNDPDCRPEISGSVADMSQYDIVFVGYPIWWGEAPRIVSTFIESYDFSGKTIIPFCTSGGSGIGSSGSNLEKLTSGAEWLSGKRFNGGTSRSDIIDWVNGLGLNITAE